MTQAAIIELYARIERLRHRQKVGDPDITSDELQAAITRAESKRRELLELRIADDSAAMVSMLPRAAERCRQQVLAGWLEDKPEQAAKARVFLREYFGGVRLIRGKEPGSLYARALTQPVVLLSAGNGGRGEALRAVPAVPLRIRVK